MQEFQSRGIAQEAIRLCEEIHGKKEWEIVNDWIVKMIRKYGREYLKLIKIKYQK